MFGAPWPANAHSAALVALQQQQQQQQQMTPSTAKATQQAGKKNQQQQQQQQQQQSKATSMDDAPKLRGTCLLPQSLFELYVRDDVLTTGVPTNDVLIAWAKVVDCNVLQCRI